MVERHVADVGGGGSADRAEAIGTVAGAVQPGRHPARWRRGYGGAAAPGEPEVADGGAGSGRSGSVDPDGAGGVRGAADGTGIGMASLVEGAGRDSGAGGRRRHHQPDPVPLRNRVLRWSGASATAAGRSVCRHPAGRLDDGSDNGDATTAAGYRSLRAGDGGGSNGAGQPGAGDGAVAGDDLCRGSGEPDRSARSTVVGAGTGARRPTRRPTPGAR